MKTISKLIKENIVYILTVITITIIINSLFMVNRTVGSSMYPTFKDGTLLLSTKIVYNIDRGDIVAVHSEALNENILKRVIAIPGDNVTYQKGILTINNEMITEYYINDEPINNDYEIENITLGDDSYIVMGDNRNHSTDSRHFGTIKKSDIFGKVLFKLNTF